MDQCECVDQKEYFKLLVITSFLYGAVISVLLSLVAEVAISPYVTYTTMAVIIAPFVEEIFKSAVVFGEKQKARIYLAVIMSSLGFGIAEWAYHTLWTFDVTLTATMFIHVALTLPVAIAVAKDKSYYIYGLAVSIGLHALYNYSVLNGFL